MLNEIEGPGCFLPSQRLLSQQVSGLGKLLNPAAGANQLWHGTSQTADMYATEVWRPSRVAQNYRQAQREKLRAQLVMRQV